MHVPQPVIKTWYRLSDINKPPRSWWHLGFDQPSNKKKAESAQQNAYERCVVTIQRTMFSLLVFSLFCVITVFGIPDTALITNDALVRLPFANVLISSDGFLLAAPFVLVLMTIYLHVFDHRRRLFEKSYEFDETPAIFTLGEFVPRILTAFIFYWLVPFVLAIVVWKAFGQRHIGLMVLLLTAVVTAGLIWIQIRHCAENRLLRNIPRWICLFLLFFSVAFATWNDRIFRPLSLFRADLQGRWMKDLDLRDADLRFASLQKAELQNANLAAADLSQANLQGAKLNDAKLYLADLAGADLRDANLSFSDLQWASMYSANLVGADLAYANLRGAYLGSANLLLAEMRSSNLNGAELTDAKLYGADFSDANLKWANLEEAQIWRTKPPNADKIEHANMQRVVISSLGAPIPGYYGFYLAGIDDTFTHKILSSRIDSLFGKKSREAWEDSSDYFTWTNLAKRSRTDRSNRSRFAAKLLCEDFSENKFGIWDIVRRLSVSTFVKANNRYGQTFYDADSFLAVLRECPAAKMRTTFFYGRRISLVFVVETLFDQNDRYR